MKITPRMGCEERKQQILAAVRRVFARKGLEGATSRELAKEAGVSEALMFRHYPNKEALYRAMVGECTASFEEEFSRIAALESSTSTLIHLVHFLASLMLRIPEHPERENLVRLYVRSLTEDGALARTMQKERVQKFVAKMEECIKAAIASGDIEDSAVTPQRRAFLADRLAFIAMLNYLPSKPVCDLGSKEDLVKDVTWFALRGIGVKEAVIKRIYNPKALALGR